MDKAFVNLLNSDRLIKDVDDLMNSLFWIEALKTQNAKGISDTLNYQLVESQTFMKNFVRYTVVLKRILFRNILIKQTNEQKKQLQQERQLNLEQIIQNFCIGRTDKKEKETLENYLNSKMVRTNQERCIVLPKQFLIECIFLSILDLDDYIGTSSEIQGKLNEWFPEIRISSSQIKSVIESLLNENACFKRLINFTKCANQNRPIILGKRQYVWSINLNFLKPFIRYFYKMYDKRTGNIINLDNKSFMMDQTGSLISIPLTLTPNTLQTLEKDKQSRKSTTDTVNLNDFNSIFYSWKHKLEQFKLFMQIKHNSFGFSWCNSVVKQQNTENLNKLDFIKYGNPLRPKPKDRKLKNAQKRNGLKKSEQTLKARNRNKIQKTKMQPILINLQPESISSSESHEMIIEIESPKVVNQEYLNRHLNLKFDEKDCLDNLLSNEDLLKLEESKSISSMIADSLVNSNLINISSINNNYFNILPVSPTICHSFFNHNEINVAQMLGSNNETGVDELFCDELKLDGEMTIHL